MGLRQSQPILQESAADQSDEHQVGSLTEEPNSKTSDEAGVDKHLCDAGWSSFEARVRFEYNIEKHFYGYDALVESMGLRGPSKVTAEEQIRRASANEIEFLNYLEARKQMCEELAADKHLCDASG